MIISTYVSVKQKLYASERKIMTKYTENKETRR